MSGREGMKGVELSRLKRGINGSTSRSRHRTMGMAMDYGPVPLPVPGPVPCVRLLLGCYLSASCVLNNCVKSTILLKAAAVALGPFRPVPCLSVCLSAIR